MNPSILEGIVDTCFTMVFASFYVMMTVVYLALLCVVGAYAVRYINSILRGQR